MAGHTDNSIVIAAPFDLVWELTNDVTRWPRLFTEYAAAEVLERTEDTVRFRLTMHPQPDGTVWSWVSERRMDRAAREVRARRIELGWYEYMHLHWTYAEVPGGVLMRWRQDFEVRSDAPVTTQQIQEKINRSTKIQMAHIKERVEEHHAELCRSS
ncbi:putative polyketide cyclase [Longimycelium tulufanense]|uniref:Putative polyketide cyclase n=1 Tax=Longimycelium tulufanense TaxID=907463 RepID=A0A8J3CIG8_9PSEU|nr:SRPBCC family protein [Longimycelium tulufanense]GGM71823.1 putative polyketide cyclase [Longimycelium tulufanense]